MPAKYSAKEGYEELQKKKKDAFAGVRLTHLGRTNTGKYRDCHKVLIERGNGDWSAVVYFHESAAAPGWVAMEVTLKRIPVIKSYTLHTKLKS